MVRTEELTGTEAWSAFSSPSTSKKFKGIRTKAKTYKFTDAEVSSFTALRQLVSNKVFENCRGSCAYCRRSVGHYGWSWHIEHVIPKAKYGAHAFSFANLTVGCVHCNMWKGSRVDRQLTSKVLPIINPVERGFKYSEHLRLLHLGTEAFSFLKYSPLSSLGQKTYDLLSFDELERAHAISTLDGSVAALNQRMTKLLTLGLQSDEGAELVELLQGLSKSIYSLP